MYTHSHAQTCTQTCIHRCVRKSQDTSFLPQVMVRKFESWSWILNLFKNLGKAAETLPRKCTNIHLGSLTSWRHTKGPQVCSVSRTMTVSYWRTCWVFVFKAPLASVVEWAVSGHSENICYPEEMNKPFPPDTLFPRAFYRSLIFSAMVGSYQKEAERMGKRFRERK